MDFYLLHACHLDLLGDHLGRSVEIMPSLQVTVAARRLGSASPSKVPLEPAGYDIPWWHKALPWRAFVVACADESGGIQQMAESRVSESALVLTKLQLIWTVLW